MHIPVWKRWTNMDISQRWSKSRIFPYPHISAQKRLLPAGFLYFFFFFLKFFGDVEFQVRQSHPSIQLEESNKNAFICIQMDMETQEKNISPIFTSDQCQHSQNQL